MSIEHLIPFRKGEERIKAIASKGGSVKGENKRRGAYLGALTKGQRIRDQRVLELIREPAKHAELLISQLNHILSLDLKPKDKIALLNTNIALYGKLHGEKRMNINANLDGATTSEKVQKILERMEEEEQKGNGEIINKKEKPLDAYEQVQVEYRKRKGETNEEKEKEQVSEIRQG